MSALRWGIRLEGGRWLVGYWRGHEFVAQHDCPTLPYALQQLARSEEGLL